MELPPRPPQKQLREDLPQRHGIEPLEELQEQ